MCTIMNADCFVSIVLSHVENIEIGKLVNIRDHIQKKKSDIIINISGAAIHQAMTYYPSFFTLKESTISRGVRLKNNHSLKFIKSEFSTEVPGKVLDKVNHLVTQSIK